MSQQDICWGTRIVCLIKLKVKRKQFVKRQSCTLHFTAWVHKRAAVGKRWPVLLVVRRKRFLKNRNLLITTCTGLLTLSTDQIWPSEHQVWEAQVWVWVVSTPSSNCSLTQTRFNLRLSLPPLHICAIVFETWSGSIALGITRIESLKFASMCVMQHRFLFNNLLSSSRRPRFVFVFRHAGGSCCRT